MSLSAHGPFHSRLVQWPCQEQDRVTERKPPEAKRHSPEMFSASAALFSTPPLEGTAGIDAPGRHELAERIAGCSELSLSLQS